MTSRLNLLVVLTFYVLQLGESQNPEVAVQKSVSVGVDECEAATVPYQNPIKTKVVVVHNNLIPIPIECFLPPDAGDCSKDLARIFYDHRSRTCKPFSYTGCGGNANRFQSIKNCYRICHPYRYKIKPKLSSKRPKQQCPQPNYRVPPRVPAPSCEGGGGGMMPPMMGGGGGGFGGGDFGGGGGVQMPGGGFGGGPPSFGGYSAGGGGMEGWQYPSGGGGMEGWQYPSGGGGGGLEGWQYPSGVGGSGGSSMGGGFGGGAGGDQAPDASPVGGGGSCGSCG